MSRRALCARLSSCSSSTAAGCEVWSATVTAAAMKVLATQARFDERHKELGTRSFTLRTAMGS